MRAEVREEAALNPTSLPQRVDLLESSTISTGFGG
jgi:hypothetical protein